MDQTIKKGNSMIGFLRRNLKVSNDSTKTAAYLSLVRPILEYCCTVWSPYTQDYINKLEIVQRRAARYVTNRYHNTSSVTSMLEYLEWESLESKRVKCQLTMLFKIINDLLDIPPDQYLTEASTRTRSNYSHKFRHVPASSQEPLFFGIPCQTLPAWYLSNGSSALCHSNLFRARRMQVNPSDFLRCAGGDFVCPGTCKVARLDKTKGLKMHSEQLF